MARCSCRDGVPKDMPGIEPGIEVEAVRAYDMSISVEVGLLSGKAVTVEVGLDETVATLKCRAQTALGVGAGRLLDSSGRVLDVCAPIPTTRLENGDSLTMHINQIQVQAGAEAFAAILGDGSVVAWVMPTTEATPSLCRIN